MPTARVVPAGIEFEVAPGEPLMAAAERAGYRWPTVCGGLGTCRTCFVVVVAGSGHAVPPAPPEAGALADLPSGPRGEAPRLACQLRISGDVVVRKRGVRLVDDGGRAPPGGTVP